MNTEKFEIINVENNCRTGLIYKSVRAAKMAATRMNWNNIVVSDGYRNIFRRNRNEGDK